MHPTQHCLWVRAYTAHLSVCLYISHNKLANWVLCTEAFKTFPVLQHLELMMCGMTDTSLHHSDFARLQVVHTESYTKNHRMILNVHTQCMNTLHLSMCNNMHMYTKAYEHPSADVHVHIRRYTICGDVHM